MVPMAKISVASTRVPMIRNRTWLGLGLGVGVGVGVGIGLGVGVGIGQEQG